MSRTLLRRSPYFNWCLVCSLLLLTAVLVPWGGNGPVSVEASSRIQPTLLRLLAQHPSTTVRVIVQKIGQNSAVESLIVRLGGRLTRNLSIIDAVAATMPAGTVAQLGAAPGVRWISLDGPVTTASTSTSCSSCVDTSQLQNAYIRAIGADRLWNEVPYLQGQGIGVAVVDSGVNSGLADFNDASGQSRVVAQAKFNSTTHSMADKYGHGTHVAGIIAGNGAASGDAYIGVAPRANLIDVKISDDSGMASESDVVSGLQWVYNNAARYNIRVVNLSLDTTTAQSYNVDPLDAACEILWNNKIVVVVSAGNNAGSGPNPIDPPANDPFVITVGAVNDKGTASTNDDTLASFSAYGTTADGFAKPDLVAPGVNIVSTLADMGTTLAKAHPDHVVTPSYFRMSGTSMAAPIVAAAAALLLQSNPALTPDQVKYRLLSTAHYMGTGAGAGELDIYAAVHSAAMASANTGLVPSHLLSTGGQTVSWNSWDSVSWNSVSWNSVSWNSVSWNSVSWNSDYWGP